MSDLKFNKKNHTYKYGKQQLMPVTQFYKQFFEPFDAKAIARKLSKFYMNRQLKHGVRYWLAKWKADAEHGTEVHKMLEKYVLDNKLPEDCPKAILGCYWLARTLRELGVYSIYSEFPVYDVDLGLAGTIDLVIKTDKGIMLVDWKTNKEIKKKSYDGKKGKKPLEHLEDCNYNHYALQMSLYAYILERQNHKVYKLVLAHLTDDKTIEIELPYMKKEVEEMLNDNKNDKAGNRKVYKKQPKTRNN